MNQRIENKTINRNINLFKWLAGLLLVLLVFRLVMTPEILQGGGTTFDFLLSAAPLGFFIWYLIVMKNWGPQFIEWTDESISFKVKKEPKKTISQETIQDIDIELDKIVIHQTNGTKRIIEIETFHEYEDRLSIKKNFEKIKEKLSPTTPKANAAISSSADTDAVDDDDFGSLGIYGKPH